MSVIPYGRQDINQADIDAVVAVLRSDFLTQGPAIPAFEKNITDYCGAQHAVAVSSATSALHIACLALGVSKGDIVWTTPVTFVASANCALYCGATVDFVDIDPRTYNLCVERLAEKLALAEKVGRLPKVVIPVHLCGQPCDMTGIHALSQKYGFKIIEDASHAIGGKYKDEPIGNCHYSNITIFSFHPVKIITTSEGGMAVTNDVALAKQMRLLRSHGITNASADLQPRPVTEIWNYQQIDLGFNYRMTDIQAALGVSQMQRLDEFVTKRHAIAKRYNQLLSALPVLTPWQHDDSYSGYHLYVIRLKLDEINKTQRQVYDAMHAAGILVNLHYIPVYRQPYYEQMGFKAGYCPKAEHYYSEAISIPLYSSLTEDQQYRVVVAIREGTGRMNIAIIPARGGSKRIPRKNIKEFCGKPMIAYAITAAKESGLFGHIVVSTDDEEIARIAKEWGAETPFVRPAELANDYTATVPVVAHAIESCSNLGWQFNNVCCIYPAVPFIQIDDIRGALALMSNSKADYCFPVTEYPSAIQRALKLLSNGKMQPFYPEFQSSRTQDLDKAFHDAGQFYWGKTEAWLKNTNIHGSGLGYVIQNWRVVDIDTPYDWERAEIFAPMIMDRKS